METVFPGVKPAEGIQEQVIANSFEFYRRSSDALKNSEAALSLWFHEEDMNTPYREWGSHHSAMWLSHGLLPKWPPVRLFLPNSTRNR